MKVYKTNSGLGYNEYAYFVKADRDGINYVCIGVDSHHMDIHSVGKIQKSDSIKLEETDLDIWDFAISKTYFFGFWVANSQHLTN